MILDNISLVHLFFFTGICTNNTFKLVGSESVTEGSVQVCQNGVWGPVCDDQWDVNDAAVVCRALGYSFNGKTIASTD